MALARLKQKDLTYGMLVVADDPQPYSIRPGVSLPPKGSILSIRQRTDSFTYVHCDGRDYYLHPNSGLSRPSANINREHIQKLLSSGDRTPIGKGHGTFGNDPEIFVTANGTVMPAFTFLPSKHDARWEDANPKRMKLEMAENSSKHYLYGRKKFWDGFQAEFTVPPHQCFGYGCDYIRYGLQSVLDSAKKANPDAKLTWAPVVDVPQELLASSPQEGVALGCDPSLNAYTRDENPRLATLDPSQLPIRFAGFHIHIGQPKLSGATYRRIVRMLDAVVGVVSVAIFEGMEDPRRRLYYGLAGEYRLPEHGLEWRVLSSCVLCAPGIYHLISDLTRVVACLAQSRWHRMWKAAPSRVQDIINNLNVPEARKLIKENEAALKLMLKGPYAGCQAAQDNAFRIIDQGAQNLISLEMHANWRMGHNWENHSHANSLFWSNMPLKAAPTK